MKIPKETLEIIHNIESLGSSLKSEESKLYKWLEENNLNIDVYDSDKKDSLDLELEFLFQRQNGKDLIKKLEEL